MVHVFEQTWLRPPTRAEREALIDDYIREEILYREAVAAGLHENDQVIRLRLQQQLEFVTQDLVDAVEPSEQELTDWLEQHREQFMSAPEVTFEQIYLSPQTLGRDPGAAERLLAMLRSDAAGIDAGSLGDMTQLPSRMDNASPSQIERSFGPEFAGQIAELSPAGWVGPVTSGYGSHLVRVIELVPSGFPDLASVRTDVEAAWRAARRKELDDRYYAQLRSRYTVELDAALTDPQVRP
jgi:parvulin-like peptidyl-prolyl isomerase